MKRVGRVAEFLAWTLFFALAALILALRFWLLPHIERYRDEIVSVVSRSVGQPVRIGGLEAGWLGLNPRLHLTDVRIYDREGREALVLPSVDNVIAWSSLLRGELRLHSVIVENLRLQVRRDAAGDLYVAGNKLGHEGQFSAWALAQHEIVVRNAEIEWHDEKRGAPPLALSSLNLRLRNEGDEHSIGLTARPPEALGSLLDLRAVLDGRTMAQPAGWTGRVYAELGYTDLAGWRAWMDYPLELERGQGALRMWLTLEDGEARQATADLALAHVRARLGQELAPLQLASVEGRIHARAEGARYEVAARGLALAVEEGPSVAPTDFRVAWDAGQGAFTASALALEPLAHLAASLPLPDGARQMLADTAPRGELAETRIDWTGAPRAPAAFSVRTRFSELSALPWRSLPGFAGITGTLEASQSGGKVRLMSRRSALSLPQVFPDPTLTFDFLDGQVEWDRRGESAFAVRVPSITFANAHLSGNAHATYTNDGEGPGSIDLSAQFNRADAAHTARYLPHARLMGGPATRAWVARAIVAGQSSDVRVRVQGDLREFPFTNPARGQFRVAGRIDKGVLDYAENWPRIDDIQGELLFERDRMEITGRSGAIRGVALANVRVAIPHLGERTPQLAIAGQAEGPTQDFLGFIQASPVRGMVRGFTDEIGASGRGRLRLKLDIPLMAADKARVAGEYELLNNSVSLHPQVPPVERVAGKLSFTESALMLHDVRGQAFGGPLAVSGGTRPDGSLEILARGDATAAGLRPVLDHPLLRQLSGGAPYVATAAITDGRLRVRAESSLRGLASALPAPLSKSAADSLPLRVDVLPLPGGERILVTLGRVAAAEVQRRRPGDGTTLQRAAVALSPAPGEALRLPEGSGTLVYGSLAALDADQWRALLAGDSGAPEAAAFDVRIGRLDVLGKRVSEVALRGAMDASGWTARVSAKELAGDLAYRSEGNGRLVARLTHFALPDDAPGVAPRPALEPGTLPAMDLVSERFVYRGRQLGRIELAAQRAGEDWRIDRLTMTNADATLKGTGVWRSGTPSQSRLEFDLRASDAGQFLGRVGYPDLVKGGKAQLSGTLAWNGQPAAIDYPSLSGAVHLQAEDGQFLEIEPGIGKLISLMSLQSLPRRISLDFRDVFSKGFEFETISSDGQVERGVMAVKDFRMVGSSAQVNMSGDVDLAKEAQDLRVRVVPSLGDSASTVIALVNPLLAIPAAIAQKILKDPLGHIFAFNYAVTGSWADPKVAKIGVEAQPADLPSGQ